ncbi:hypothetical protein BDQ17DRAFT_1425093 [Cyathus striatus]|nr:hypothetical protein BDQ17DRAFT_1425093 [Cyathus striatus]
MVTTAGEDSTHNDVSTNANAHNEDEGSTRQHNIEEDRGDDEGGAWQEQRRQAHSEGSEEDSGKYPKRSSMTTAPGSHNQEEEDSWEVEDGVRLGARSVQLPNITIRPPSSMVPSPCPSSTQPLTAPVIAIAMFPKASASLTLYITMTIAAPH